MPIYEYRRPDGSTFEVQQSFSDETLTADPDSGVPVERVLHAPAVHFKGKGFYNTDYGTRKRQRENAASAETSPSTGDSSSSGDNSTDTAKGDGAARGESKQGEASAKPQKKAAESKPVVAAK